jgi:outer membrane protein assembly factor BamE (lipoprotein component of BamABCDE complex)
MKNLFLLYFIFFLLPISCGNISGIPFDSEQWKNANLNAEENWSLRWDMMDSLRNDYELVGKTKSEIIDLLGNPDNKVNNEFYYYLGYSKRGINTGNLRLYFDSDEKVSSIKVTDG